MVLNILKNKKFKNPKNPALEWVFNANPDYNATEKHLLTELINFVTITIYKKESATHFPTSTTITNLANINSMVIFQANFSQR